MNILRLKEVLTEKGVSQKALAEKIGVSQNTISNIVNGHHFPRPEHLVRMAEVLDVDIRELFISTKRKDMSDPVEAIKEIQRIIKEVDVG